MKKLINLFKGGTEKIGEPPERGCQHPGHNPPMHQVFSPGTYKHTCPNCGQETIFTVPQVWL